MINLRSLAPIILLISAFRCNSYIAKAEIKVENEEVNKLTKDMNLQTAFINKELGGKTIASLIETVVSEIEEQLNNTKYIEKYDAIAVDRIAKVDQLDEPINKKAEEIVTNLIEIAKLDLYMTDSKKKDGKILINEDNYDKLGGEDKKYIISN